MTETTYKTDLQARIAREFCDAYGLSPEQIWFDDDSNEPIFDFEALSLLTLHLANFRDIAVAKEDVDFEKGIATCSCTIIDDRDNKRQTFTTCFVGESLDKEKDGRKVEDLPTAISVARTRALRQGLRLYGFDPLRAHRQQQAGQAIKHAEPINQRTLKVREIHALATEMNYIKGGDKSAYRELLSVYYKGRTSTSELTDAEVEQFAAILRGLNQARERRIAA
jgi:hypothetical protein